MKRLLTLTRIVFFLSLGVFLFVVPWHEQWTSNFFTRHYFWLATLARNYFVRGAVSGIGLADIWMGILEVWRADSGTAR
jgi:hypothetical protein